ncbi:cysteine desulfurase DndA [Kocuria sp. CPCC 205292]|uniref:cysteine desulfurase DndA n=1 Tax=Kocuria cellulosilytica TaxID=3071451 RepID=UPI0034D6A890
MEPIYMDMAATTPVSERVSSVVTRYMVEEFGNAGSRTHEWGTVAKKAVGQARKTIAQEAGCAPEEVIFTSGATEADNIALLGLAPYGEAHGRRHIISCATEHKAVLEPLEHLAAKGFEVELLQPDEGGRLSVEAVMERVREDTLVVSLMHVNNETGVRHPVAQIAEYLRSTGTYFHVDAAQSFAKWSQEDLQAPIDLVSISGHKLGAPKGIGALVTRRRGYRRPPLEPLMFGGGQERSLRPGTLSVALIVGLAEAVRERRDTHQEWLEDTVDFRRRLMALIASLGGVFNGDQHDVAPHILNVSIPGVDSEALIVALRDAAAVAAGSACTSSRYTPSHVLTAMGLDEDRVAGAIRLSWWGNPLDDLSPIEGTMRSLLPS